MAAAEDNLDRPVTLREFNALSTTLHDFRHEFERFLKKAEEDRAKMEKANNEIEEERTNMQRKWDEGKMVDYLLLFFKVNQGNNHYPHKLHVE